MALRELSQFHKHPAAIAWWIHRGGRALVWLTPPARRRTMLALAAVLVGVVTSFNLLAKHKGLTEPIQGLGAALVVLAQFMLVWLVYRAAQGFARLPAPLRRHPQLALHGCFWAVLAVLWATTPAVGPWRLLLLGLACLAPMLLWRCGYLLLAGQHGRLVGTGVRDHLLYLWPAYGGSETPYGKGLAYLSQCEAKTTEALARSQLAGIKLLLLAVVLRLLLTAYEGLLYGPGNRLTAALGGHTLGLPKIETLLVMGTQAPWVAAWASVYLDLFAQVLRLAVKGHLIVGFMRLYGFNVFRNTYKPLLAESVVEFWNRYFYYFKELLATFFFMPTFTGLGKRLRAWPRLRLLVAVLAAALVGNVYYHVIKEPALVQGQFLQVLLAHRSRMFYCLLLAVGIYVSMLRQQNQQNQQGQALAAGPAPRMLRIFGVWTFFGLISIWNTDGGAPFLARVDFFLRLFGVDGRNGLTGQGPDTHILQG